MSRSQGGYVVASSRRRKHGGGGIHVLLDTVSAILMATSSIGSNLFWKTEQEETITKRKFVIESIKNNRISHENNQEKKSDDPLANKITTLIGYDRVPIKTLCIFYASSTKQNLTYITGYRPSILWDLFGIEGNIFFILLNYYDVFVGLREATIKKKSKRLVKFVQL